MHTWLFVFVLNYVLFVSYIVIYGIQKCMSHHKVDVVTTGKLPVVLYSLTTISQDSKRSFSTYYLTAEFHKRKRVNNLYVQQIQNYLQSTVICNLINFIRMSPETIYSLAVELYSVACKFHAILLLTNFITVLS